MNLRFGLWSAVAVTAAVILFGGMMLLRLDYGAYAMSMIISWAYLVLACSFSATARPSEAVAAQAGVAFGVLSIRARRRTSSGSSPTRSWAA